MARRASAFSRQAAASCGKLVAAALRNRAAMMRRIRSQVVVASGGAGPLAVGAVRRRPALLMLLVASVALSTLLQVAVAPPTLVGYLTAGATPVWLLGSFAVLSLLYRTPAPAEPAADVEDQAPAGSEPSKRERARAAYAALVATGQPVTGARLAEAAGVSASYGRALLADFQADPTLTNPVPGNGQRPQAEVGER